jgi:hypothetical protein
MSLYRILCFALVCTIATIHFAAAFSARQQNVLGGPRGALPYLLKSVSTKSIVETARDHQWSITFTPRNSGSDTVQIIALRIEFNGGKADTSPNTTGDGTFGMRGGGDMAEYNLYTTSDTVYKYDNLPHGAPYFAKQLEALATYYKKVSRGKLVLLSTIYPADSGQIGYPVPQQMTYYSPPGKKAKETWNDFYYRKTQGLMFFIRDALRAAAKDSLNSPFSNLRFEPSDSSFRDITTNRKTVFLILHAGSSYLTDGGKNGSMGANTPSDMIDAFVDRSSFAAFKDSLKLSTVGVPVRGHDTTLTIDEVMMCSETSNQDQQNWGIQGILVNQVARQIGIPDLFSASSGNSGVGAFCIMDFAGYEAGNGFIPPYPSAWVRAFMGWDKVMVTSLGEKSSNAVKAITSVLDRDTLKATGLTNDTTILLVPINDHEYYLVENRQRNLSGNPSLFYYDTVQVGSNQQSRTVIAPYPYNVNIDSNVVATSNNHSNVITRVRNNDVGLPASGVVVWHVDEKIIRDNLAYDLVNADSLYKGVTLVEADGVYDIGVQFTDAFSLAAFDYGGAEDVFPHVKDTSSAAPTITVSGFGPFTAPSTTSNDGGKTYLHINFDRISQSTRIEKSAVRSYTVDNYPDSVFTVTAFWDYLVQGWPRFAAPESFFEPVLADLDPAHPGKELVLESKSGRLYAWSTDSIAATYGNRNVTVDRIGSHGDTIKAADTAVCVDSIGGAVALPSAIGNMVFVPSRTCKGICVLKKLPAAWDTIALGGTPSSYVCRYRNDSSWAVGCEEHRVVFGKWLDTVRSMKLSSASAVCAIAALREKHSTVAAIQLDGTLSLCNDGDSLPFVATKVPGIGPYTLVTGDLDRDSLSEIVVCDSRHGLWVYKQTLLLALGWEAKPSDWPSAYLDSTKSANAAGDRSQLPVNLSSPALVDLNRDGRLDVLVGGTNGLYAFNYKGVLIGGWPSYLDTRYWYQRGSVVTTPIALTGANRAPLVVFSSPTGGRATFTVAKVLRADRNKGTIWFMNDANALDSISGYTPLQIDTVLKIDDSLITPYIMPGGFVDAVMGNGKRPPVNAAVLPTGVTPVLESSWPLTTGSPLTTSPLAGKVSDTATLPDLFAVATGGWVYRWKLAREIMPDSLFWPQVGFDEGRSFAYGGGTLPVLVTDKDPITFFSYPNPAYRLKEVTIKYKFSGPATKVRFDIITFSGFSVFSSSSMGAPPSQLTGSYPDWNEFRAPIASLGPAVYRCRLEATIGNKKYAKFWKLAVTK